MSRQSNEASDSKSDYLEEYVSQFKDWEDEIVFKGNVEIAILKPKNKLRYRRRFIAVTKYRFLIFRKNSLTHKTTVHKDYHLLELKELGRTGERGVVTVCFHPDVTIYVRDNRSGLLVKMIRTSYRQFTFGWPEKYTFKLSIPEDECEELDTHYDPGPCNGFKFAYIAFCNQRRVVPREDFIRYIEDLNNQNQQELDLTNCPGVDSKSEISIDLIPVCCALQHNTFFHSFVIKNVPNKDALQGLAFALRTSTNLTKVVLRNTAAACPLELGEFLDANTENQIQVLDLSGNHFTTNAMVAFAKSLRLFNHRLSVLSLANCSIPSRGFITLMLAFKANYGMSLAIEELNISDNRLDTEASTAICEWFSSAKAYSALRRLAVANTSIDVGFLLSHLKSMKQMEWIDISGNKCDKIAGEHLVELARESQSLKVIRVADCSLSAETIGKFVAALLKNELLSELCVDLSGNDLGSKGATELVNALHSGNNVKVLNISRTGLKSKGAAEVLSALPTNVMQVILDDCCSTTDSVRLVTALTELTVKNPNLKILSIVGGERSNRMHNKLAPFFNSLKTNKTLTQLDISSNSIGDAAFTTLCAALRDNATLTSLKCDRNKITIAGYQALRQALNYNKTLCYIDYPYYDVDRAPSTERERFKDLITKILRILAKNGEPILLPDPFVFGQDWPVPPIPAPPLVSVPDTLRQEIPNFDVTYEKSDNDVRLAPISSPPPPSTNVPTNEMTYATFVPQTVNTVNNSSTAPVEITAQPPPPLTTAYTSQKHSHTTTTFESFYAPLMFFVSLLSLINHTIRLFDNYYHSIF
jgi:Ran GTPase-activating protein (RanGAP) involved in mRNA processing and transport